VAIFSGFSSNGIPYAQLCLLKDGGHAVVKTQTKVFESAILMFLQS
jgi:hypothetical protein